MINKLPRWQQFPWREKNNFQLLTDGAEIFPAMLEAINSAQSQILLEMYLVESGLVADKFIAALVNAAKRNINVYLLFDDYGARAFELKDRRRLNEKGIHTVYYNPIGFWNPILVWGWRRTLLRDHRKLLVIDNRIALVGGIGITDNFDNTQHPDDYWHEVAVKAEGPVVYDWLEVFRSNWDQWTKELYPVTVDSFTKENQNLIKNATDENPDQDKEKESVQDGRVASGRYFGRSEIQRAFVKRILGAEHHVWMMTAYFVPMSRLLRALKLAASRGVDVRLLLPGEATDHPSIRYAGRRIYHSLLNTGVRIFEYQPRFLHAKLLLCDSWVSIGSSNVDRWNLRWNLEANQEIEDSVFAHEVRELFEADFQVSKECDLQDWPKRAWYYRWLERFWGGVEILIENLSEILRRYRDKP